MHAQSLDLLDPTGESSPVERTRAPRRHQLQGTTLGLLDISKPRGDVFLDRLESLLRGRGAEVARYRKPTFAKNAPEALQERIRQECDAVIEALAD